jgi:hypothetical protein
MSETANANQNEKTTKIRRKPERESVLTPTFAAARQATGPAGPAGKAIPDEVGQTTSADRQVGSAGPAGYNFSHIPARTLTTSTQGLVQANLMVNEPGDPYEQEADRVAEAVMRMPAAPLPPPIDSLNDWLNPTVSRLPLISRLQASGNEAAFPAPAGVEQRIQAMQGGGQALPDEERSFFEARLGYDFSQVRVHTDANAVQASREIQAHAFTIGPNIAFNEGTYQPGTESGRRLLAHELTHVVQQGGAGVQRKTTMGWGQPSQVVPHLQTLQRFATISPELYRKEITAFQHQHPASEIRARQQQIMALREPIEIGQRDHSRSIRRCGGGGGGAPAAGPLTFSSDSFNAGSGGALTATPNTAGTGVAIKSAIYRTQGNVKVTGGTDAEAKDWEAGFIQTLKSTNRTAHYIGSATQKKRTIVVATPIRDAITAAGVPWYDATNLNSPPDGRAEFQKTDSSLTVGLGDQPGTSPLWDTPDGKGKLSHHTGKELFTSWMIARKKTAPNTIEHLNWTSWEVDFGVTFNYASSGLKTVNAITGQTKNTGSGTGKGSDTPVLSAPIPNTAHRVEWS